MIVRDCVDAERVDEIAEHVRNLSDDQASEADRRISVVAVSSEHLQCVEKDRGDRPEWFRLELGEPDQGPVAEQFYNLFQDSTEPTRRLQSSRETSRVLVRGQGPALRPIHCASLAPRPPRMAREAVANRRA